MGTRFLMLWKLISDLLDTRRKMRREAMSSSQRQVLANPLTRIALTGPVSGGALEGFLRQADTLARTGQCNAALECYRACIRTYPQSVDAYVGMGNVLVDLWSLEEAVAAYSKALDLAQHSSQQKIALDTFARERGVSIMTLPTGQGLLIKS